MIIFESDGSKFKLRSVFDILAGNRNLFVNNILAIWFTGWAFTRYKSTRREPNDSLLFRVDIVYFS